MHRLKFLPMLNGAATVASAAVAVVATLLWVRTHYVRDDILAPRPAGSHRTFAVKTYPGTIDFATIWMSIPVTDPPYWHVATVGPAERRQSRAWDEENTVIGFGRLQTVFVGQQPVSKLKYSGYWSEQFVPVWAFLILALAWPTVAAWRTVRRRRHARTGPAFPVGGGA